jgi:hypothetical protein
MGAATQVTNRMVWPEWTGENDRALATFHGRIR